LVCQSSGTAGVEIVPVQDGVEAKEERPLRLPPPERTNRKHDDMSLAERRVDNLRPTGQRFAARQCP